MFLIISIAHGLFFRVSAFGTQSGNSQGLDFYPDYTRDVSQITVTLY